MIFIWKIQYHLSFFHHNPPPGGVPVASPPSRAQNAHHCILVGFLSLFLQLILCCGDFNDGQKAHFHVFFFASPFPLMMPKSIAHFLLPHCEFSPFFFSFLLLRYGRPPYFSLPPRIAPASKTNV